MRCGGLCFIDVRAANKNETKQKKFRKIGIHINIFCNFNRILTILLCKKSALSLSKLGKRFAHSNYIDFKFLKFGS